LVRNIDAIAKLETRAVYDTVKSIKATRKNNI
jgi:septum formation inhibitor-activating ATPase MinD